MPRRPTAAVPLAQAVREAALWVFGAFALIMLVALMATLMMVVMLIMLAVMMMLIRYLPPAC